MDILFPYTKKTYDYIVIIINWEPFNVRILEFCMERDIMVQVTLVLRLATIARYNLVGLCSEYALYLYSEGIRFEFQTVYWLSWRKLFSFP